MRPEISPACPSCGSSHVAWIVYGLASLYRWQPELNAGRVILGGCCVFEESPQWRCHDCGHGWGRAKDLSELHRLLQVAEAQPKSLWWRLRGWVGLTFEDEGTFLTGLVRRLVFATIGVSLGLVASKFTPWVGLAVLIIWWLPLLWHVVIRIFAALVSLMVMAGLVGIRPLSWEQVRAGAWVIGFVVLTFLEVVLLAIILEIAGGWLLSEASGRERVFRFAAGHSGHARMFYV